MKVNIFGFPVEVEVDNETKIIDVECEDLTPPKPKIDIIEDYTGDKINKLNSKKGI